MKKKSSFKLKIREKEQSQRQLKVAGLINIALIDYLQKQKSVDIRLHNSPLTFTKISISPDLRVANCYFLPFNTNFSAQNLEDILNDTKYHIRQEVTKAVNLKYSPELRFHYDLGFENSIIIDELFNKHKEKYK